MKAERLLLHYERIADAPDAIPRLRRFVLDLAVRGKLVPQDAGDEPASELVKRIMKERARLINAGEIKKPKPLSPIVTVPFEIPPCWDWTRLGGIAELVRGISFPASERSDAPAQGLVPCFRSGNIQVETVWDDFIYVPRSFASDAQLVKVGDILISIANSYALVGKCSIVSETPFEATFGAFLAAIRLHGILPKYAKIFLTSEYSAEAFRRGSAQTTNIANITFSTIRDHCFPLPPLAEQHRIVAKVDELMNLCDRLEAAQTDREATRDRLAAASLARLNVSDSETFHHDARFALDALSALTARPDQIKALRQTILKLAVRGKLVPQNTNEEPASELLARISAENEKLLAAKGIRSQKPALPAENFEADSEVPPTWCHAYLQDIAYQITDGTHLTPKYTENGKPFLSAQNVKPFRFMPDRHRFVSEADFNNYRANRRPERGDILMTRVGAGIGEAAVLDSDFEFAFYVSLCLIKVPSRLVSVEYLVLWLNSPEGRESSANRTYGKGASQGNLNLGLIRTFKIPLPPLAEQRRIVAKVGELMALCDRLEASLTATTATRRRLLDALLAEAVAPANDRELEAAE